MHYPGYLKVSGFPITLMGWNGLYKKRVQYVAENKHNIIYQLPKHRLFGLIPISSIEILFCDNQWLMTKSTCQVIRVPVELIHDDCPIGLWTGGIIVVPHYKNV